MVSPENITNVEMIAFGIHVSNSKEVKKMSMKSQK